MTSKSDLKRALIQAVETGDQTKVLDIAARDPALIDQGNAHGNTPLLAATAAGQAEIVRLLLELGADPRKANHGGGGPLEAAASTGRTDIAALLIDRGAEPSVLDAAGLGDLALLERILEADQHAMGPRLVGGRRRFAPLHMAVMVGQEEAARWLLDRGAKVDDADHNGHSPLAWATRCASADARARLSDLLLAHGADPDGAAGHFGGRVLHESVKIKDAALVKLLLDHGADPNTRDAAGKTPLHEAVAQNAKAIVALLLAYEPDLSIVTRKHVQQPGGETALDYARRRKRGVIARILEQHGAGS